MVVSMETLGIILFTAVLTPVVYFLYHVVLFIQEVRKRGQAVDQFPSDPKHWLYGHVHLYPSHDEAGLRFQRNYTQKWGRVTGFWMGPLNPTITVHHPDIVKKLLLTAEPKPHGIGVYKYGRKWLGDGLLMSKGKKWARNRRLLTPAFHFEILKPYMKVNNAAADIIVDKIQKAADRNELFEFFSHVSLCTLDIILRCAFSYDNDCQIRGQEHPYVKAVNQLGDLWVKRSLQPWNYFEFIYSLSADGKTFQRHCDYVHSVSEEIIARRKKTLEDQGEAAIKNSRYLDFLDILLTARDDEGKGLTDQEIRDEVDTFLFEGHDTTASSISWVLYSMAEHQEIQEKCQEEIDQLLAGRDSDNIEWEDLSQLKYLTLCIKESMRLHCPVPFIERVLTKEMVIDGVTLPPGSIIDVQIYNLHHNPLVWEEPMDYRPERFLQENIEKKDTFAFVPFSAGPRNCIGQNFAMHEQKVIISRILRRFHLELDPDVKIEKKIGVVMKTKDGMRIRVTPRSPKC